MSFMGKKKNLLTLLFILLAMPLIAQEMIVKGNVMSTDNETLDRKSTRLNSSHDRQSRMPSSA